LEGEILNAKNNILAGVDGGSLTGRDGPIGSEQEYPTIGADHFQPN